MLKCFVVAVTVLASSAFGSIEVACSEFAPAQQDEIRSVVAAVTEQASELFRVDLDAIDDGARLELHLLINDYNRADDRLNGGRFRKNWAFANSDAMEAHVALQPPVPNEMLEAAGIPLQTKIQIAHEAAHLCIYRATNNHASHPSWFSEGIAIYLANKSLRSIEQMGSIEETPWTSTKIFIVKRLYEDHPDFKIEQLLNGDTKDISTGRIDAARGMFIAWLDELGILDHVFSEARRFGGGSTFEQRIADMTLEAIDDAGIGNPSIAFLRWINDFEPQWYESYRSLQTTGNEWAHSAFSSKNAVCWNSEELGNDDWTISGAMKIFDADKTQLNVLVGRSDRGWVSVAVSANWGVTVFDHQIEGNKWIRLANEELRNISVDEWMDFKVSKRRDRLLVRIGKNKTVRVELNGLDVSGAWGLGAQQKSSGLWRDVKIER